MSNWRLFVRLIAYLKSYGGSILGALACMLFLSLCNIFTIPLAGHLTAAIGAMNFAYLNWIALLAVVLYFTRGLFTYGQIYLMSFAAKRVVTDLRIRIFEHLQNLSLDFYAKWKTGEVISRSINDISMIEQAIPNLTTDLIPNALTVLGVVGYLFYLNWHLAVLSLFITPLFLFTIAKFGGQMREIATRTQQKAADLASILQENISGARIIKSFTMEHQEIKRFRREAEQSFGFSMKESQVTATLYPLIGFLQVLGIIAVIWYGGWEVVQGRLTVPSLVAFFAGIALLIDPIIAFSRTQLTIQKALSSAERVFEIIDLQPTVKNAANAVDLPSIRGEVVFENVAFSYQGSNQHAITNINVHIKPGEVVALVGPSGSGKSTFVNLIPRFYDPKTGVIKIDGTDIRTVTLNSLRRQMGIVPQETMLFTGTLRDNIAYGNIAAEEDAIIDAARMANADTFIENLPQGYYTLVGERGANLSGGECQRIAIARAILRNPRILILDEATSSLDTESERLVQEAMEHLMRGRTTFIIAHRLSTVQFADRILVLDQGRIVETGTHHELSTRQGVYQRLYDLQFHDD